MKRIGVIVAMSSELEGFLESLSITKEEKIAGKTFYISTQKEYEVVIVISGIGKVNASISATLLLSKFGVDLVINTGVAGGLEHFELNTIVIAKSLVQHDLDITAFGRPLGFIPSLDCVEIQSNNKLVEFLEKEIKDSKTITLASGDQFICSKEDANRIKNQFNAKACDMESCAIAQVCSFFNVPFVAIRLISDSAGDDATSEYQSNLDKAAKEIALIVVNLMDKLVKVDF